MAERKMTPKGFLKKIINCKSAEGFIAQYREYMLIGELYNITTPIVDKLDSGELLPTPALEELSHIVFAHVQASDLAKAQASLEKSEADSTSSKPVMALIYNRENQLTDSKGCNLGQEAMRWVDRRLFEASPGSIGKIVHQTVMIKGAPMEDIVTREDAFARILGTKKKGPVMKRSPQTTSRLSGIMKVGQSRANFSHG